MNDCIFCKIIKGDIPSYTVYENNDVKAFLDTNPNADGHVLVVPKTHYENLFDTPDEMLTKMIDTIKTEIYPLLKEKLHVDVAVYAIFHDKPIVMADSLYLLYYRQRRSRNTRKTTFFTWIYR